MPSKNIGSVGRPWKIRRARKPIYVGSNEVWGYTCWSDKEIVLSPKTKGHPIERDVLLHECIHKYCPFLSEDFVNAFATELDDILDVMEL